MKKLMAVLNLVQGNILVKLINFYMFDCTNKMG